MRKKRTFAHRAVALLLAGMMCMTMLPMSAFAENTGSIQSGEEVFSAESGSMPSEQKEPASTDASSTNSEPASLPAETNQPEGAATPETADDSAQAVRSEAAQAFVAAVGVLDREEILASINAWAAASQAWQADQDNPDLTAALEDAIAVSDAAAAPVYAAEDLYNAIPDEERGDSAVQAAYATLTALVAAMHLATETPQPPKDAGTPPDLSEIAQMLYDDLPDAPTGSYIVS